MTQWADIAVIGLGVMGKNLALNLADNGFTVAVYDLDKEKIATAIAQEAKERFTDYPRFIPCQSIRELNDTFQDHKTILLSVPAGAIVDTVCTSLIESGLTAKDIVIDTGNSHWQDTIARHERFDGKISFFSAAVSGGEQGARFGPSLMASGQKKDWQRVQPFFEAIAAKVDNETGLPLERHDYREPVPQGKGCAALIGVAGSGHFVKMVHNGIEYADMQLLAEACDLLRRTLGMTPAEVGQLFEKWCETELNSYLLEISADILQFNDPDTGKPMVDMIMDKAGQKGTGTWTAIEALKAGSPSSTIAQSVFARSLSMMKEFRQQAAAVLSGPDAALTLNDEEKQAFIDQLFSGLLATKVVIYAQGFELMSTVAKEQDWQLNFAEIAGIWRAGCIIRATILHTITLAYAEQKDIDNLMLIPSFAALLAEHQGNWRKLAATALMQGVPMPTLTAGLNYYDGCRSEVLPANLIQAQRDFFGAHLFRRVDKPETESYHVEWHNPVNERQVVRLK